MKLDSLGYSLPPWSIADDGTTVLDSGGLRIAEFPKYGAGFAASGHTAPWHLASANARLASASPELLEALENICRAEFGPAMKMPDGVHSTMWERALSAIRKAKGEPRAEK